MDDPGDRVDRLWSSLTPPAPIVVAIVLSFLLAAPLIFFPDGAARYELDSLAFGIGFCWLPAGIVAMLVAAFRARTRPRRAWGWIGAAVLIGLAGMLLIASLKTRGTRGDVRMMFFVLCIPCIGLPLLPAVYQIVKAWREMA